jgi:hypothetical protein
VELQRVPNSLVVPRDAIEYEGGRAYVRVQRGGSFQRQEVSIAAQNGHDAALSNGVGAGSVLERNIVSVPAAGGVR